jgi:hypothetical protein
MLHIVFKGGMVAVMELEAYETHTCPVCHVPWTVLDHILGLPIFHPNCGHFLHIEDFEEQLACDFGE